MCFSVVLKILIQQGMWGTPLELQCERCDCNYFQIAAMSLHLTAQWIYSISTQSVKINMLCLIKKKKNILLCTLHNQHSCCNASV